MFYQLVKPLAKIALRFFFKHIYWVDYDKVPEGKAVIFAANHPTAFVEPCIMACFADRPLYFLVRGDFFRKKVYNFLLKSLHMLPIFRRKDGGFGDLKNNLKTFSVCSKALSEYKSLMILAEGCAENEKRLRPIQKGTARLALSTLHEYSDLDLVVVPVGVNYSNPLQWRSEVLINFGDPIPVQDYLAYYQEHPTKAINQFTKNLEIKLRELVWHVEDAKWDDKVDQLLALQRSTLPSPNTYLSRDRGPYIEGYHAIEKWNKLDVSIKQKISDAVDGYFTRLSRWMIQPRLEYNYKATFLELVFLVVLFPIAAIGLALNFMQGLIAKWVCDTKVKSDTFYTPVLIAIGTGINLLLVGIFAVLALVKGTLWWLGAFPLIVLLGIVFLYWFDHWTLYRTYRYWNKIGTDQKAELEATIQPVKKLLTELD